MDRRLEKKSSQSKKKVITYNYGQERIKEEEESSNVLIDRLAGRRNYSFSTALARHVRVGG